MTAPERIWADNSVSGLHWTHPTHKGDKTEYIRADLAAVQPAQVRVKPLVWEDDTMRGGVWADTSHGWCEIFVTDCGFIATHCGVDIGCYFNIAAAKSAAQADYEARILAALEPQPDPRDEVIKGLVDALRNLLGIAEDEGIVGDKTTLEASRAALAAAKAVQK